MELIGPDLYSVEERIREQSKAVDPAVEHYFEYAIGVVGSASVPRLHCFLLEPLAGLFPTTLIWL